MLPLKMPTNAIVFFCLFPLSLETPTNALPDEYLEEQEENEYNDEMTDLFSGAKEMEAYQESQAVKKSIQFNLGRREGPRWSLPHQYIGEGVWSGVELVDTIIYELLLGLFFVFVF